MSDDPAGTRSNFYSHASCEARRETVLGDRHGSAFLLTRLLRGATVLVHVPLQKQIYFYSHASCEARLSAASATFPASRFLLTRLLRGATTTTEKAADTALFLLTRLLRGATKTKKQLQNSPKISTHTPLARRDAVGRRDHAANLRFLLTRLLRGATGSRGRCCRPLRFLLTRLLRGATKPHVHFPVMLKFLLTRLLRGATTASGGSSAHFRISTHTPLARRDSYI